MPKLTHNLLTDTQIRIAKPKDKAYNLNDGGGLCLVVSATGAKYWQLRTLFAGKLITASLGKYPAVSLSLARAKRDEWRAQIAAGIDPRTVEPPEKQAQRETNERAANRFDTVARAWLATRKGQILPITHHKLQRDFEIHILPVIGAQSVQALSYQDIDALLRKVAATKSHHGREMTYLAKKLCSHVARVCEYWSHTHNGAPVPDFRGLAKYLPTHKTHHMRRIDLKALPAFVRKLEDYLGTDAAGTVRCAIWLLLLTGQRSISVRRARWRDIDFDAAKWTRLPEKKHAHALEIPLPRQAVEMLKRLKADKGARAGDYVFTFAGGQISDMTINKALKTMGYAGQMTGHGLRSVVNTALKERGCPPVLVEIQLDHAIGTDVSRAYGDDRISRYDERAAMMQDWADYLEGLGKA